MLTTRSAAPLLAAISSPKGPGAILALLGFQAPARLDRATARAIGVTDDIARVSTARRAGMLRVLVLVTMDARPLRAMLATLVSRLAQRSPQFAWLLLVVRGDGGEAAIATWVDEGTRIRRAALICEPSRLRESDAETLCALVAASGGDDALVHLRWHEILGRQALSTRFYRALEHSIVSMAEGAEGAAPSEVRRTLALTTASRLLFLSFLQSRGWLDRDPDFLVRHFDVATAGSGNAHRRLFEPLFFGTLNTRFARRAPMARRLGRVPFLNGGLFARSPLEMRYRRLRFRDEELGALFDDVLTRFRFTAHEDRTDTSEAAIDPEMLGRAFESLMASRDRRDSGAFYTPQALVERTTEAALDEVLVARGVPSPIREALIRHTPLAPDDSAQLRVALAGLRLLDPACGSGAFLVHLLERLTDAFVTTGVAEARASIKRRVLTSSIFGVDINPMAVWLCELRLWLSTVIDLDVEDPLDVPPLPNLDRNVRVGDALDGGTWIEMGSERDLPSVVRLRERYARATGRRKSVLARAMDMAERTAALTVLGRRLDAVTEERWSLLAVSRGRDLFGGRRGSLGAEPARRDELKALARSLRAQRRALGSGAALPFRFASHFADAMQTGGFDLVIGNPPWVRIHRIPPDRREAFRRQFRVFRDAAWQRGALAAGAGPGFAAQVDLAALFAEQSMELVRRGGVVALLLPIKLWRSLAGGGVRRMLSTEHTLKVLEDWSDAPAAFDAAVYPSLIVARRGGERGSHDAIRVTMHKRRLAISWGVPTAHLAFDDSPGAPWIMLPPDARRAFSRMIEGGVALERSHFGSPTLGVKCGCNDAFLVSAPALSEGETVVASSRGNVRIDSACLRPMLRGERVRRWRSSSGDDWIVWTHGRDGRPLRALPPATSRWLARWRSSLTSRTDVRGNAPWWSLFRTDGASNERPRVVWADVSRGPRATVLPAGSPVIPLNTCYVMTCRDDTDAAALVALLNSPLVAAWLEAIAEPARGGYRRYLAWTMSCVPIPTDWMRARQVLAPLGARAVRGEEISDAELFDAACDAYGLGARVVAPLVDWAWR
ncbi:MAG: Eco57I restriction-modification methylase domain-containing protein [Gemmatimonadaceae bacterium]